MNLSKIETERLKEILKDLENKYNAYIKTDTYKWVLDNMIPKSKNMFDSYKEYKKYIKKRKKECSFYCSLKATMEEIEYEINTRETIKIKNIRK